MRRVLAAGAAAAAAAVLLRRASPLGRRPVAGRTALIAGGSRGLGLQLARELVRRGAAVAICARDEARLDEARRELEAMGGRVVAVACDVADHAAVERMVADVEGRLGSVDILLAVAGIITVGPLETQTLDDFRRAMDVMYWGAVHPVLAVLPGMRSRGEGSIAVITSIGGRVAVPHLLPYTGAKFAAVGLSEGLRAELAGTGVRVTTVIPGLMRTGSHVNAAFKGRHRAEYTWFSLGASAPLLAIGVERAARRVVDAVERGEAEVDLGLPAAILSRVHGLLPATTARVLGVVGRLLPDAGGAGDEAHLGADSESAVTRSPLTALGRRAARSQGQGRGLS